jgi:tetratricopeptide (TPR) repeat protein
MQDTAAHDTASPDTPAHETTARDAAAQDLQPAAAETATGVSADAAMRASQQFELGMKQDRRSAARLAALREAVRLDPTQAHYQRNLAMEYYLHGEYQASIDQVGQTLRIDPDNADLMTLAGSAYFELTQYDRALEILDRAAAAEPQNLYASYNRALTLEALGSPEAREAWASYIALAEASQDAKHHALVIQARENLERLSE